MLPVHDPSVQQAQRPGVMGGRQVRPGTDADVPAAVPDKLANRFSARFAEHLRLAAGRSSRHDEHVEIVQAASTNGFRADRPALEALGRREDLSQGFRGLGPIAIMGVKCHADRSGCCGGLRNGCCQGQQAGQSYRA